MSPRSIVNAMIQMCLLFALTQASYALRGMTCLARQLDN